MSRKPTPPKTDSSPPPKPKTEVEVRHRYSAEELKALLKEALPCVEEYKGMRGGDLKAKALLARVYAAIHDRRLIEAGGRFWCDHVDTLYLEPCRKCVPNANDIDLWIAA